MSPAARRALSAVLGLVAAALAVWAATRLLRTDVPSGLERPEVDVDETFGADEVEEASSFEAFLIVLTIASQLVALVALGVYAFRGARFLRDSAAGPIGSGFLLGMLAFAVLWIVQLPFVVAQTWWMRRKDVVEVEYVEAVLTSLFALWPTFLQVCFVLLVAMGFAKLVRQAWWVPAGAVLVGLVALLTFVSPYLVAEGLTDADARLQAQTDRLVEQQGIDDEIELGIEEVSDQTSLPNAYAMGLGPSRRIVLYDTLADRFPRDQVRATLAHEVGHHAGKHLAKGIALSALVIIPTALLVALLTAGRGGMRRPEAVPLAIFVVVALGLVTGPLQNAASRQFEAEADWKALEATRDPEAVEGVWRSFTARALADPDPPGWFQTLYGSHPSGVQRVEMARAWAARNGG
ncbi:MAG TPA: M48 family metalloprotease [Capillimicrobium sp.]|jgi:STE24 endopeptidase